MSDRDDGRHRPAGPESRRQLATEDPFWRGGPTGRPALTLVMADGRIRNELGPM